MITATARRAGWHGAFALSVALVAIGEAVAGPGLVPLIALGVAVACWPAVPRRVGAVTTSGRVATSGLAAAVPIVCATAANPAAAAGLAAIGLVTVALVAGRVVAAGHLLACVAAGAAASFASPPAPGSLLLTAAGCLGPVAVLLAVLTSAGPPARVPAPDAQHVERLRELTVVTERARFALEMQNALGHHLTAATMVARGLRRDLPAEGAEGLRAASRDVEWFLRSALAETRRVVRVLGALPAGGSHTLADALAVLIDAFRGVDVRIDLTVRGDTGLADVAVRDVVYRVAQNSLVTAARHPAGADVVLLLEVDPGTTALTVLDRGALRDDGPDLVAVRALAASIGGRVEQSTEAGGTVVRLRVPTVAARATDATADPVATATSSP